MGDEPARKFYSEMRRRNEFEEWGLEVSGGWGEGTTWLEVVYVRSGCALIQWEWGCFILCNQELFRGDTPAERAGLRLGDRLITVNDVFVVFLNSKEVFQVLNMNNTLVAWLEVER